MRLLVDVRGRPSPLLCLYEFFDIQPVTNDLTRALLVVIDTIGESRCLMVDQLVGQQEVVIKSPGETFKTAPAIAGGAILSDGSVGLIIDVHALVHRRHFGKCDLSRSTKNRQKISRTLSLHDSLPKAPSTGG